jgi:hypothetical protein
LRPSESSKAPRDFFDVDHTNSAPLTYPVR